MKHFFLHYKWEAVRMACGELVAKLVESGGNPHCMGVADFICAELVLER